LISSAPGRAKRAARELEGKIRLRRQGKNPDDARRDLFVCGAV
jgi:hypothetical protein